MTRRLITTPRDADLGLATITNAAGLTISVLPNGSLFSIEHRGERSRTMINQILGQPLLGGIGRILLRIGAPEPFLVEIVGPRANVRFGADTDAMVWDGSAGPVHHRVTLSLHPTEPAWLWRIDLFGARTEPVPCDVIVVQDVGLGDRGFVMGSEAYVSQYVDHHIAEHPDHGFVVMSRQAQAQGGRYPWLAQGIVEGAGAYATDAMQLLGPLYRQTGTIGLAFGQALPAERLQHEVACPMLQSRPVSVSAGSPAVVSAFGVFVADHPTASQTADLERLGILAGLTAAVRQGPPAAAPASRSLLQTADAARGPGAGRCVSWAIRLEARVRGAARRRAPLLLSCRRRPQSACRPRRQGAPRAAPPRGHAAQRPGHDAR